MDEGNIMFQRFRSSHPSILPIFTSPDTSDQQMAEDLVGVELVADEQDSYITYEVGIIP